MKISQAEIDELKRKYGLLLLVKIPVEKDETAEFIITYLHIEDYDELSKIKNRFDFIKKLLNKVVLAGDMHYIEDGKLFNPSVYFTLVKIIGDMLNKYLGLFMIFDLLNMFYLDGNCHNQQTNESRNHQTNHSGA